MATRSICGWRCGSDQFTEASKWVAVGSGAERPVKDYLLSRFACYFIAQNGDPRKKEVAAAQAYFIISTRENELTHLLVEQEKRLHLRERISENNKKLALLENEDDTGKNAASQDKLW